MLFTSVISVLRSEEAFSGVFLAEEFSLAAADTENMTLTQTQKLIHQTKGGRLKLTLERPPKPVSSKSRAGSHYESALSLYDSSSDYNRIRSGSSGYSVSLQNLREANRAGSRLDIRLVHSPLGHLI